MYLSYLQAATIKQHVEESFKVSSLVPMLWSAKRPSAQQGACSLQTVGVVQALQKPCHTRVLAQVIVLPFGAWFMGLAPGNTEWSHQVL